MKKHPLASRHSNPALWSILFMGLLGIVVFQNCAAPQPLDLASASNSESNSASPPKSPSMNESGGVAKTSLGRLQLRLPPVPNTH